MFIRTYIIEVIKDLADLLDILVPYANQDEDVLGYKMNKILQCYDQMVATFCPFKAGDRVRLINPPVLTEGHGWIHGKNYLIKDAKGEISSIEWDGYNSAFVCLVRFDEDRNGYQFPFNVTDLELITK